MNEIVKRLPPMLFGEELEDALKVMPSYDDSIRAESAPTRLMELSNLYRVYFPTKISREVYSASNGNPSVIISLIAAAQELAILNGTEKLDISSLNEAYTKRLGLFGCILIII